MAPGTGQPASHFRMLGAVLVERRWRRRRVTAGVADSSSGDLRAADPVELVDRLESERVGHGEAAADVVDRPGRHPGASQRLGPVGDRIEAEAGLDLGPQLRRGSRPGRCCR